MHPEPLDPTTYPWPWSSDEPIPVMGGELRTEDWQPADAYPAVVWREWTHRPQTRDGFLAMGAVLAIQFRCACGGRHVQPTVFGLPATTDAEWERAKLDADRMASEARAWLSRHQHHRT